MDIASGVKAKVYEPKLSNKIKNLVQAKISTYEGPKQDGTKRFCAWNTNFVGDSFELAKSLVGEEWIEIISGKVENKYNQEKQQLYVNVTVFEFSIIRGGKKKHF